MWILHWEENYRVNRNESCDWGFRRLGQYSLRDFHEILVCFCKYLPLNYEMFQDHYTKWGVYFA